MPRSHKGGADGVVSSAGLSKGRRTDHPVRDKSERIHFLDVADSPPRRGGECARRKTLSKKLKVAAFLHKRESKSTKKIFLCLLCPFCAFCGPSPLLCASF